MCNYLNIKETMQTEQFTRTVEYIQHPLSLI